MASAYEVLGLNHTATQTDVRRKYRQLALRHHPDKKGSTEEFQKIQNAYEALLEAIPDDKEPEFDGPSLTGRKDVWYKEQSQPSFHYLVSLGKHLCLDAEDIWNRHVDLVSLLRTQGRRDYEIHTNWMAEILSNLEEDGRVLEGRCLTLNGTAGEETELWSQRKRQVKDLQKNMITLLSSVQVIWAAYEDIKAQLEGQEKKLSSSEWKDVMEMLRKVAHP